MSPKLIVDQWSQRQKEQYLERHFEHEISMLKSCTDSVLHYERIGDPNGILMALEGCLLHGRNLQEFFFKPRGKTSHPDTVLAYCFVQDEVQWEKTRGPIGKWPWLRRIRDHASSELAHLSTTRTGGPHTWDCPSILNEASRLTLLFLSSLPPSYAGNRMLQDIKRRCGAIGRSTQRGGVVSTSQR